MADKVMVNGILHDWESLTIVGPHGAFLGITEISWKSKQEKKLRYGKGGVPRGRGRANYEPEASITIDTDEYTRLSAALGGDIYRKKFPIVITSTPPDALPDVTELKGVMINSVEDGAKQGDDTIPKKLELSVMMIARNGINEYS